MDANNRVNWGDLDPFGCPCGVDDHIRHTRHHMEWSAGVALSDSLAVTIGEVGLVKVTGDSPLALQRLAYRFAQLLQREESYDFPLSPHPDFWREFPKSPVVYLAIRRRRAIAALTLGVAQSWWTKPNPSVDEYETHRGECPAVIGVFVCAAYRGREVGRHLIERATRAEGIDPSELAWNAPLSPAGERLAKAVCGAGLKTTRDIA